ncbi:MAG: S9 family peptidase, partial [Bacteroidales bacterium]|nr:S9 family peptidase [Bacteroidales bacterium]
MNYPETRKSDIIENYHGTEVPDPYRWLEDDMSEETAAWVQAQNEVTFNYLAQIPFREKIRNRLEELWNYERMGTPWKEGPYYFYSYNNGLQNQNVIYITKDLNEKGEIFLDPNTLSEDGTVALSSFSVSHDGRYAGYGIARAGSDWNEFFIKDIETGKQLEDHLKWIKFSGISWYKDGFFYSRYDKPEGSELSGVNENKKLYYHKAGTAQEEDELIYQDPSKPLWSFEGQVTSDEKHLVISVVESTTGNAIYYMNLSDIKRQVIKIVEDFNNDHILAGSEGDRLFFLTNYNAPMYRLVEVDLNNPGKENWKDVIPENPDQVLKSCSRSGDKFLALYEKDARSLCEVYLLNGEYLFEIELPGIGTITNISARKESKEVFYGFTSYNVPTEIYSYDPAANTSSLLFRPEVDFNPEDFITSQIFYESKDGTKVPMFIVHRKGLDLDGKRPTLLYGYGGFNVSYTPSFSVSNLIWLENNGVYVLANIRGGGEYGEKWHQAGTIFNKQNVFDDFIAAAEYLIDNHYTSPDRLAIYGVSNGGLLVGAVSNQRPDLFAVSLPAVGVMDMLRFHKFTIGKYWVTDYGSSDDPEHFEYIYKYSPLHNIREGVEYPAVLVTTGDHDDRVVPAHSFKYIAT